MTSKIPLIQTGSRCPGNFQRWSRRPLSPLRCWSSTVVLTVLFDRSVTCNKHCTWKWCSYSVERQPKYVHLLCWDPRGILCWMRRARNLSVSSLCFSSSCVEKKIYSSSIDVISYSYIVAAMIKILIPLYTSVKMCVFLNQLWLLVTVSSFSGTSENQPPQKFLSQDCCIPATTISIHFVLADLIIFSKRVDNHCENNQAHQGITSENPTVLHLLSDKFFIMCLLSFIPLTLQILTECRVHLEEKKEKHY